MGYVCYARDAEAPSCDFVVCRNEMSASYCPLQLTPATKQANKSK